MAVGIGQRKNCLQLGEKWSRSSLK